MGSCLSKGNDSETEQNGYRHVSGGLHNHKTHEPLVNQSRAPPASSKQHQMIPQILMKPSSVSVSIPSPRPVIKQDTNTILGKQFEDVKQFYTLGKELGRGNLG